MIGGMYVLRQETVRQTRLLGCLSVPEKGNAYWNAIGDAFVSEMEKYGYRSSVISCGSDIATQLTQLQTFLTRGAALIAVACVGNSDTYEDFFAQAHAAGCRIVVMEAETKVKNCDAQTLSYPILPGLRACELLKAFLDQRYPYAGDRSVPVLLLETTANRMEVRKNAGYQLLAEKYLRRYDAARQQFSRFAAEGERYYLDADDRRQEVDETGGGLLLDGSGYAQLNPFYDRRVRLYVAENRSVSSNLDGQAAVDAFLLTAEGAELRIVLATNGEAGVGAAERLLYYCEAGVLKAGHSFYAVFGANDTALNRELVAASAQDKSFLRGFVCAEDTETQVEMLLEAALSEETQTELVLGSGRSALTADTSAVGLVHIESNAWQDPNMFFAQEAAK